MKKIATDIFTFEDLIRGGFLYVDKTRYVHEIVNSGKVFFLSRPRRFGKSLLLSTFKAYFEGKKELFRGMDIERLAPEEWEEYPVIHLDLASGSSTKSFEDIVMKMQMQIANASSELEVSLNEGSPAVMLHNLIYGVRKKYDKDVVVLVDEYDKPILDSMFEPYINETLKMMSEFYQELKSANAIERFVFITGITKFAHVALFSGSNNPTDLTRNPKYATLLGYTEEELLGNFGEYIDKATEEMEIGREELLGEIKKWYNGMRFVRKCESVYNPVSVGKLFFNMDFSNYWYDTGNTHLLMEKIKNTPFKMEDFTKKWQCDLPVGKYELEKVSVEEMAIQNGYFTIAEWRKGEGMTWDVRYDYPNKEIRDSWYSIIVGRHRGADEEDGCGV